MVKIANVAKAVGVWAGAIYLLYGNDDVASFFAGSRYLPGLAISRSPEGGAVYLGAKGRRPSMGARNSKKEWLKDSVTAGKPRLTFPLLVREGSPWI